MAASEESAFLVVIGAGPGGYPAAFQAADLGMEVVLVDREPVPGGVCLYRGCIPSKAVIHACQAILLARETPEIGISFGEPEVDLAKLNAWKAGVVGKLAAGLGELTAARGIGYIQGAARFVDSGRVAIQCVDGTERLIRFEHAIVATGSVPAILPFLPDSDRIMDSTAALELKHLPKSLLVVGGGYIGLELGQVYASLGVRVSVVEALPFLLPGLSRDLVAPLVKRLEKQLEKMYLATRVSAAPEVADGVAVSFAGAHELPDQVYEALLVAVGRTPVSSGLGLDEAGVDVDGKGFIKVDGQQRTSNPAIQAVGDVAGQPLLAHDATHAGRTAVEALNDGKTVYDPRAVPAVVFTDPEIAWCGLTEEEARRHGRTVSIGTFPWQASGRAAAMARPDGLTKVIADADDGSVLGVGICGPHAGEMISEGVLAIEMGATAEDIALTIHPHPTLSETLMVASERTMGGRSTHYSDVAGRCGAQAPRRSSTS